MKFPELDIDYTFTADLKMLDSVVAIVSIPAPIVREQIGHSTRREYGKKQTSLVSISLADLEHLVT